MTPEELKEKFCTRFPEFSADCRIDKGHVVADVPLKAIEETFNILKNEPEFDFKMYMDFTAVDWLKREPRFDLVYHLYSVSHNHRIRIKSKIKDGQLAPTLTGLWSIADWMEREIWDLYGIKFNGHPNMKRILLYEEFKGHPLRKDYPYKKRQPRVEELWPSRNTQVQVKDLRIHRGD